MLYILRLLVLASHQKSLDKNTKESVKVLFSRVLMASAVLIFSAQMQFLKIFFVVVMNLKTKLSKIFPVFSPLTQTLWFLSFLFIFIILSIRWNQVIKQEAKLVSQNSI